ncbi:MAG TPA: hypothetical protein VMZ28_08690 [Kofleriaceae bacterium]|nr:hypothetical protein [Kofleriaceae bacterium]
MRATLAIVVMFGCSGRDATPTPTPTSTPSPTPIPSRTPSTSTSPSPSASCAEIAVSPPRREERVSFRPREVQGKNLTASYEMSYVAVAGGQRWAGSAYDGAALWDGSERLRHIACVTSACLPHEVAFTDGGKTLLVGLSRFDVETGQGTVPEVEPALESTGLNEIESVAWGPDGALMVVAAQHRPSRCCRDRATPERASPPRFLALDGKTGALVKDLGQRWSQAAAVSATQIVAATRDGLTVWDRETFTPTLRAGQQASRLYLHPDGALLASVAGGEITLWRMPDFCPVARFAADREFVQALAFHPTAPVLFTAGTDRTIRAFSTSTAEAGMTLGAYPVPGTRAAIDQVSRTMAVTADGRLLVVPLYMDERVLVLEIALPP